MVRRCITPLFVGLLALAATLPAVDGTFLYDDHYYVVENPAVVADASVWASPLGDPTQSLWRPLTVASFRAQWQAGARAGGFLAFNVAAHALTAILVFALARRLGLGPGAGCVAAALFAVHPVHAEAVAWITGRAEILATLGVVSAWIAYLSNRRGAAGWSAALLVMAALSKENALAAPALFLAADLALGQRPAWRRLGVLGLACAAVFATRGAVLPELVPLDGPFVSTGLAGRIVVALNVIGISLRLLAWPHPLRIDYHRDELSLIRTDTWIALVVVALIVLLLWRRQRPAAMGLLLVPVALATVLHLVPIGEPFAERFLYLPSVPFCLAAGFILAGWCGAEARTAHGLGPALIVTIAVLGVGLAASRSAMGVFHDELTLWSHAVEATPDLPIPRYNLGRQLDELGRHLTQDRDRPGCREELARSLELEPRHAYAGFAHHMLGNHDLGAVGNDTPNPRAAADHYRAAIELLPTLAAARINLATVAVGGGDFVSPDEALRSLAPLLQTSGLEPDQRAVAEQLAHQLSGVSSLPEETKGTSSPDGS